ncbi:hypothetical protein [Pseudomonas sp. TUM22785]|uniref:hypothetical protein n=1 Tax=Pseudomonas sp. TUM22785 TaxID=3019098 RepID=UPI002305B56F|nr:hypothetical protein [Pseudomonas sp. TUM22785]WCD79162.1 hypothetical protein PI990_24675 [Pseudomonas sp. TUM22785]
MVYASVLAAVVSALAAETIDNTAKQAWQKLYRPGHEDGHDFATLMGTDGAGLNRTDVDCWVFARLHSQLKPRHWDVLAARYGTHKGRKVGAIGRLCPLIPSHAPKLFVQKAVTAWAIPQMKGVDGKRSCDMIVLPRSFYDMNSWDLEARPEQTRRRWRGDVRKRLDEMVEEALIAAGEILEAEGLLFTEAA